MLQAEPLSEWLKKSRWRITLLWGQGHILLGAYRDAWSTDTAFDVCQTMRGVCCDRRGHVTSEMPCHGDPRCFPSLLRLGGAAEISPRCFGPRPRTPRSTSGASRSQATPGHATIHNPAEPPSARWRAPSRSAGSPWPGLVK
jgi:hypothetical protein